MCSYFAFSLLAAQCLEHAVTGVQAVMVSHPSVHCIKFSSLSTAAQTKS